MAMKDLSTSAANSAFPCTPSTEPGRPWGAGTEPTGRQPRCPSSTRPIRCPRSAQDPDTGATPRQGRTPFHHRPQPPPRNGGGVVGKALDASVIRPALGWATDLSFDRLRLRAESDVDLHTSRSRWLLGAGARAGSLLVAGLRLRRARTTPSPGVALAGVAATLSPFMVPSQWAVPRARRCLRRAPSTLAGLKTSGERGVGARSMERGESGFDL